MNFAILIVVSFAIPCRLSQTFDEYNSDTSEVNLNEIRKILRLRTDEVNFVATKFDVKSPFELVYPKSLNEIERLGKCELSTSFKGDDESTSVLVKMQRREKIVTWMSQSTKKTYCSRDLCKMRSNCYERLVSAEYYAAKLIANKPRFLKFYATYSLPLITTATSIGISPRSTDIWSSNVQILTYSHLTNTENLKLWYLNHQHHHKTMHKLKVIFKQIHSALVELLQNDLVYTDLKPENILVNLNSRKGSAYLIGLDSVVFGSKQLSVICKLTIEYFPPVYGATPTVIPSSSLFTLNNVAFRTSAPSKLVENFLNLESTFSADRLLTWQFCLSLYSLVCSETFEKNYRRFSDRSVFVNWKQDNQSLATYLKCSGKNLSPSLISFFDSCLYRKSRNSRRKVAFHRLIEHEWFDDF